MDINFILKRLEKYLDIPSPSGFTRMAMDTLEEELDSLDVKSFRNKKDALIAEIPGKNNDEAVMITAHIDTLGAMVKYVEPDGRIRYNKVGGGAWSAIEGENCNIHTRKSGNFRGSVLPDTASTHIYGQAKGNQERNQTNMYIRLDEKIQSAQDVFDLGINIGDYVSMDTRLEVTESGFIKSRYLDNKLALAIALEIIKDIKSKKLIPEYKTYFYFSNYEESGHGLGRVPEDVFELIAIDIGIVGEKQNSDEYSVSIAARDNKTPYNYEFRNRLLDICDDHDIQYKLDLYNFYSTDASQAMHQGQNFNFAAVGPGVTASHHYERTHLDSVRNTRQLLYNYILGE